MDLETINELIECYEYQYNLCLDEGEEDEAEAYKQQLDDLYEQLIKYNG